MTKLELRAISLDEYSKKELDWRYLKIVEDIAPDKVGKLRECRKSVRLGECEDHGHKYYKGSLCRLRDLCPVDASGFANDQGEDAFEIMNLRARRVDGHNDRVWYCDLDLPREAWNLVSNDGLGDFRTVGIATMEEMFSENGRYLLWYRIDAQYWHSRDVMLGWYPHLHITLSSIAYDTVVKKHVRLNFWQADMRRHNDSKLSRVWKKNFEAKYGTLHSKRMVTWFHYSERQSSVKHWVRYAARSPVIDLYKALYGMMYRGTDEEKAWLARLLLRPDGEKRGLWCGIASSRIRRKYLAMLNIILPDQAARRKVRRRKLCLECGSEIHWGRWLEPIERAIVSNPNVEVLVMAKPELRSIAWMAT